MKGKIVKYSKEKEETKQAIRLKFSYHWVDNMGIRHFTTDKQEADKALHKGCFIQLIPRELDERVAE